MPEHRKLLYCKDFYTASNFYPKIFQLLKKSDIAKRAGEPEPVYPAGCYKLWLDTQKQHRI